MEKKEIRSRLGMVEVKSDEVIRFPRGLIGFEQLHEFALLQIKEGSPFLLLQSLEEERLGLIVADPYSFLTDYQIVVEEADRAILDLKNEEDLTVLVTVTIPPGRPEKTTLNLTGPIVINASKKVGLQIPQVELKVPSRVEIATLKQECIRRAASNQIIMVPKRQAQHPLSVAKPYLCSQTLAVAGSGA